MPTGTIIRPPTASWSSSAAGIRRRRGRDDDGFEGGFFRPALRPVADPIVDVRVAQPVEDPPGPLGQRPDDLDRPDLAGDLGQDGRLVAGPGPDLEDLLPSPQAERLGHVGDDVGLGDRLAVPDRQGLVGVGVDPQAFGHEDDGGGPWPWRRGRAGR